MVSILRKLLPGVNSVSEDVDDHDLEYSIAMIYSGDAVNYSIPEIAPFKIDQIPIASLASVSSDHILVPVIQPVVKTNHTNHDSFPSSNSESLPSESTSLSLLVESSNSVDNSGSLDNADDDGKEDRGIQSEKSPANSDIIESGSSSHAVLSEISPSVEGDCKSVTPRHVKRPSTVAFRDPESNDMIVASEKSDDSQAEKYSVRPKVQRTGKKGTCYRCHKGNRFTEKEICIVCDAKYCHNCVLRAMGCMPEGRKCITCIHYRVDENKRRNLGKCSWMLKHLLSEFQVKQIMQAEMSCEANQIPAELVCVNGKPLNRKQMTLLLSCPYPPKKLRQGFYWYDKASGLWGKEGQRPSQIISPKLDVGDNMQRNASNGNTGLYMNGREITKEEMWMLTAAGVPCEGKPSFWVNADGSYREEGQKKTKGHIWNKTGAKLACFVLSLPRPPNSVTSHGESETVTSVIQDFPEKKMLHKFLIVGSIKSGTSTIFKQAKLHYNVPFSENERQNIKMVIQSNLYTYLGILLEGRENFEEESLLKNTKRGLVNDPTSSDNTGNTIETTLYSVGSSLKALSDSLMKYTVSGNLDEIAPTGTREFELLIEELWRDAAIQATYNRRNELEMLPRNASYFLERAIEISKTDYEASDMDILYAEGITLSNSLASMEFSFPKSVDEDSLSKDFQHDPTLRYQLIRVHPRSLGEHCKWLDMFEDTDVVLFCVALTDYDEYTVDSNGVSTNKMLAAKHLFENMITHPAFKDKKFLLLLNKFDLLEEKIKLAPLKQCQWFCDFNPVIGHNHHTGCQSGRSNITPLAHRAFQYIAVKFKRLFCSLTNRKLYVSLVTGLEPDTVDEALRYAREIMVCEKWNPSIINEKSDLTSTFTDNEEETSF